MGASPVSPFTPQTLTGVSTYSSDFQSILTRQVQIASLPVQVLQGQDATVLAAKVALDGFSSPIDALASSITALGTIASSQALSATSSDTTKVTVQDTGATAPANYTISNITSIASAASETSNSGYADSTSAPVSTTGTLKLVVGANNYTINLTPAQNNLVGLETAINNLGVGLTATILTTGTGATPNYLSVSSNVSGATTLQLFDDPTGANTNLLTNHNQGSNAVFQLNGVPISQASNTVNAVVSGLTFNIVGTTTGTQTVALSLASDSSQLSSGIQNFVSAYNTLFSQVQGQLSTANSPLSGDSIIQDVARNLQSLITYQGSGSIKSFSDLGITSDATGKLTFDPTVIAGYSPSQLAGAFSYFGSATTGFGAQAANFTQISDPVNGLITLQEASYTASDQSLQTQIATKTAQISTLQATLSRQLAAADALVAELQSQQQIVTASVQSVDFTLYGRQNVTY
ncbi:MAG: flagellar filament capping protein FliD [Bryobacteraceae bacterium]